METLDQRRTTFFVDDVRFPFCKGCSHTQVLRRLNEAMTELQLDPAKVALVTDIGCIGLADGLFRDIHTVHTTHGRSTAFASGIALADGTLADGALHVIVLIGDGGAMIGLQHLVHAAMLNVRLTVIICNNFVYGMTGGQGSGLTPDCFVTATTPRGNLVPPADLCGILVHSNAPFVVRTTATDPKLSATMKEALSFQGFSAIEVLELCTEYAVPKNELTGKKLAEIAEQNRWALGSLSDRPAVPSFDVKVKEQWATPEPTPGSARHAAARPSVTSRLTRPISMVIAGSAGERVQSSATALCQAGADAGLFVTQKNDNPVTQGSGFSLSEIWISPEPVLYTGIDMPDVVVVASEEGYKELDRRGTLDSITAETLVIMDDTLPEIITGTVMRLPLRRSVSGVHAAMSGALIACRQRDVFADAAVLDLAARRLGDLSLAWDSLTASIPRS